MLRQGRAVQVDPMKPMLKAPGITRLKLQHDEPPSRFAFNFNLRRYSKGKHMQMLQAGAYTRSHFRST